jgi:hypothetical protein
VSQLGGAIDVQLGVCPVGQARTGEERGSRDEGQHQCKQESPIEVARMLAQETQGRLCTGRPRIATDSIE